MRQDDFFNRIKDCWTGRKFFGRAIECALPIQLIPTSKIDWYKDDTYMLEVVEEDSNQMCTCRDFIVLKNGQKLLCHEGLKIRRLVIEGEIESGILMEIIAPHQQ